MDNILEVSGLNKRYGNFALKTSPFICQTAVSRDLSESTEREKLLLSEAS